MKKKFVQAKPAIGILLCLFFLNMAVQAQQPASIHLKMKNALLMDVLDAIEKQTKLPFIYNRQLLENLKVEEIDLKGENITTALNRLLPAFKLTFKIDDGSVLVYAAPLKKNRYVYLSGKIVNEAGERLPFASISIDGSSLSATSDEQGSFGFQALLHDSTSLRISYLGYHAWDTLLFTGAGNIPGNLLIRLSANTKNLDGVAIKGMRKGEVIALNSMREAPNMKYVLSQEQIERFPDATVGEALQRVPGLTMAYNYGLPQAVIMRGLEAEDGSVTFNGNRLPSTEPRYRTVDLNGILSSTVERIEVIKTLTPDMEGDGTAGTVNIITKAPPKQSRFLDIRSSGGYNFLSEKGNFDAGITFGKRNNKWGYVMGANYMQTGRGEDRIKKSYGSKLGTEEYYTLLKGFELEATNLKRRNTGLQGELNFYPRENEVFYIRGHYNQYRDEQQQYNQNFAIKDYTSMENAKSITIESVNWYRKYDRSSMLFSAGGKKNFNKLRLDFDLSFAQGIYKSPEDYRVVFEQPKLAGDINLTNPKAPQVALSKGDASNAALYNNKFYNHRREEATDRDMIASLNLQYPFHFFRNDKGFVKVGGRFRHKYNERNRGEDEYKYNDDLPLTGFLSGVNKPDFFHGNYGLALFPDALALHQFFTNNKADWEMDETASFRNSLPDTYEGREIQGAGYVMLNWKISKLEITTGLRYENTSLKYDGNMLLLSPDDKYEGVQRIHTSKSFNGFLPGINIRYGLGPKTNLRAAITRSVSRPGYFDLVPWEEVRPDKGNIKRGNPNLKQAFSTNYDLLAEHYFQTVGLLSAGFFYKKVKDKVYKEKVNQIGGEWDGYTIETPLNGKNAQVYGFELAWQQQFTFLPGIWNGLGIYANFTRLWSTMQTPNVESGRKIQLPNARPSSGNIALSYEKFGFSGRIAANFFTTYTSSVGDTPPEDQVEQGRLQLDISAAQKITRRFSVFVGLSNLTNAPISTRYADGRPDNDRNYGVWGNIGFRFSAF